MESGAASGRKCANKNKHRHRLQPHRKIVELLNSLTSSEFQRKKYCNNMPNVARIGDVYAHTTKIKTTTIMVKERIKRNRNDWS